MQKNKPPHLQHVEQWKVDRIEAARITKVAELEEKKKAEVARCIEQLKKK